MLQCIHNVYSRLLSVEHGVLGCKIVSSVRYLQESPSEELRSRLFAKKIVKFDSSFYRKIFANVLTNQEYIAVYIN